MQGFSLLELLFVFFFIGLLASLTLVFSGAAQQDTQATVNCFLTGQDAERRAMEQLFYEEQLPPLCAE